VVVARWLFCLLMIEEGEERGRTHGSGGFSFAHSGQHGKTNRRTTHVAHVDTTYLMLVMVF